MTHDVGIQIEYSPSIPIPELLHGFIEFGWSLYEKGEITILPLGDNDEYKWVSYNTLDENKVIDIIKQKYIRGETIGVILTWRETDIGVIALFGKGNTISFSLSINRVKLIDTNITDVSWYLPKLINPCISNRLQVVAVSWKELI